jgi:hypothetical protein
MSAREELDTSAARIDSEIPPKRNDAVVRGVSNAGRLSYRRDHHRYLGQRANWF